jgi:dipeptidyl aminopeptidase/acylaminoacyl peptidase
MTKSIIAPYGSWKSPITSDLIVRGAVGVGQPQLDGEDVYWLESRPQEGGRSVIVKRSPDGTTTDITPPGFNTRTKVHEYGGGDYVAHEGVVYCANFSDQQVYRLAPDAEPQALTAGGFRYADFTVDAGRGRVVCVREDHMGEGEAVNTLVAVSADGSGEQILAAGYDFYSSPALSPDGKYLAWLCWNHPNMPWDGTELWRGEVDAQGAIVNARLIAGGPDESIFQPQWSLRGYLHFVSDRSGWWNLYALRDDGEIERDCAIEAECGQPQWVFGMSTYAFVAPSRLVCAYTRNGVGGLAIVDTLSDEWVDIPTPYTDITYVRADASRLIMRAASPTAPAAIVMLDLARREWTTLRRSTDLQIDPGYISIAQVIEFPTENGLTAHGFYYPPTNQDFAAPSDEKPPLLVMSHGGPTSATTNSFLLKIQYWTSRGFAVLDVNYGGSTGYGRAYRRRLNGEWGVVDTDDCCNGAKYLVAQGLADAQRLMITGGSAGGYTTLCALTFRDTFKAGASHYGVSDVEALEIDTHKFESRYNRSLLGPYPEHADLYRQRSPVHYADQLSCPVIFFQGLEDKVVPPNQSETMFEAVRRKGIPTAYVTFEGEQHGFRQASNIKRALDGELYFYSRIFGFAPADEIEPVEIENLP